MQSKRLTSADHLDTWDEGWAPRLSAHVMASGAADVWTWVRLRPGRSYAELAEELGASASFGVAPIHIERLQVQDTPDTELPCSVRDSLARHLRENLRRRPWGEGPYWQSRVLGALVSWSDPWAARVDVTAIKHRLFEVKPAMGWVPADGEDQILRSVIPDR
jgi:hypothetical protein